MDTPKKERAAPAQAAQEKTTSQSSACNNTPAPGNAANRVTILETTGPALTKVFHGDGRVDAYDDAKSFKIGEVSVANIRELSAILTKLHSNPKRCIIRGTPKPKDERPLPSDVEGTWRRKLENFTDEPKHFALIDIDSHKPDFGDPVEDPVFCIQEFIESKLPACFHGASFHWQLSSSAGTAKAKGVLKAHVWFWLETPYTSAQLYAWARNVVGPAIDSAVFRNIQVHFTADPQFVDGAVDPVSVRSGFCQGKVDAVPLVLDQAMLDQARAGTETDGSGDHKLTDPSQKKNLIGAFHRAFDANYVLTEFLPEEFEQVTDRRWTWLNGGGTPEGVWVHNDGMHVGASHNTWPLDGIVNLWDLVRVFKFGHLDKVDSDDDFERLDMETRPVNDLPSHQTMVDWVSGLPEIQALLAEEKRAAQEEHAASLTASRGGRRP